MIPNLIFTDALNEFCAQAASKNYLTTGSINSYKSYLNTLESANGNNTIGWIKNAISDSEDLYQTVEKLSKYQMEINQIQTNNFTITK